MNPQEEKWIKEFKNLFFRDAFDKSHNNVNGIIDFIHKTREEAMEEGYKRGYKLGSEINIPVKGRLTETWNLAIQACVEKIKEHFGENTKTSNKIFDSIRTSLLSLKK